MDVDDQYGAVVQLGKVALVMAIGVIILSGLSAGNNSHDSVNMTLTKIPSDGETISLNYHVFEFDSGDGVAAGNIPVQIANTVSETGLNLRSAIQNAGFGVSEPYVE
jgi:hypothetical protein